MTTNTMQQVKSKEYKNSKKLLIVTFLLCTIAGFETTLLLYSADLKNMEVMNNLSLSQLGLTNFIIQTSLMGLVGLLVTFLIQIILTGLLFVLFKKRPVPIHGIWRAVLNMGAWLVIGSGVNAIIAILVNTPETTFTSLAIFIENKQSLVHTLLAELELFYIISLFTFSISLKKYSNIGHKKSILITVIIALFSLIFHIITVSSGTYLK
ncbi:hypothetical protein [Solibacillus merdavium]|uniref:Yip1 domain-containing protein n=1 Tax=Solibacillus merdavium TaxID=2762218 RepID=A0ABR8XM93_9BACL|nr:hypothetical protein [Solibacillus merdavium]MBD8033053.1 hypothetical protein [Solibacillus merdavium]